MADRVAAGMARLNARLKSSAGQTITYRRGVLSATVAGVTLGTSLLRIDSPLGGPRREWTDLDVVLDATLLVLGEQTVLPERGDEVVLASGDVYEVLGAPGEPPWRWCDGHHVRLRIHCKKVR